jgi:hypothetical protein
MIFGDSGEYVRNCDRNHYIEITVSMILLAEVIHLMIFSLETIFRIINLI